MLNMNAVLTKTIMYYKNGFPVVVMKGTTILVDTNEKIAIIGHDHVDVSEDEYEKELLTC